MESTELYYIVVDEVVKVLVLSNKKPEGAGLFVNKKKILASVLLVSITSFWDIIIYRKDKSTTSSGSSGTVELSKGHCK